MTIRFPGDQPPPLQFGEHGELTLDTINQANLSPAERERALEILEAQHAYVDIIDTLSGHVIDPEGNQYDLTSIGPAVWSIAWTLALVGYRRSGPAYIKKRFFQGDQVMEGSFAWVDSRAPDDAAEELRPEHSADDPNLPPDTRYLAAQRDGAGKPAIPTWDGVKPKIVVVNEPRPDFL